MLCIFIGRPNLWVRNHNGIELSFEYDIWGGTQIRGADNRCEIVLGNVWLDKVNYCFDVEENECSLLWLPVCILLMNNKIYILK